MSARHPPLAFDAPEAVALPRGGLVDFHVAIDGWRYDCRFNDTVAGDRLVVVFNGAVDRERYPLPVFARWNWHALFGAPVLAVCDPLLHHDPALRIGWFLGTREHDATAGVVRIARQVAQQLGIAPGRLLFWGSSSGGFAAIVAATRLPQGRFVAVNPQTALMQYYRPRLLDVAKLFLPGRLPLQIARAHPLRWSAIEAVRSAHRRHTGLRGLIVQNTGDAHHHDRHYLPFCAAFGLDPAGGAAGGLASATYADEAGHGPETPAVAQRIVAEWLPAVLDASTPHHAG
jgi:hypothetical protein